MKSTTKEEIDKSREQHFFLQCIDHSVSGEKFSLYHNPHYDMLITWPKPDLEKLPVYYKSENYISHTDSGKNLIERLYQIVKKYTLRKKIVILKKYSPNDNILLDIGAGTGDFLLEAKKNNWKITGTEPNEEARSRAVKKGVTLSESTKDLASKSFDIITMWHVLEHVPDLEEQINEIKRLCKPKGLIVIAVPNFKSYDAKYYQEFWAAYDVPRHLWHFSDTSIRKLCEEQEMELIDILPMWLDSFYVSLLSEKYKNGKSKYLQGFWRGLLSNLRAVSTRQFSSHIYILRLKNRI